MSNEKKFEVYQYVTEIATKRRARITSIRGLIVNLEFDDLEKPYFKDVMAEHIESIGAKTKPTQQEKIVPIEIPILEPVVDAAPEAAPAAPKAPKSLLTYALACIRRGWFVFPCYPQTKKPAGEVVPNGVLQASNDENQVRAWWAKNPNYNPAIALGPSNLVIYDFDEIKPFENLPPTFTVKTGRVPKDGIDGLQLYYVGSAKTHGHPGGGGEVRSRGAYVMAPGSIHPSGNAYTVISNIPLAASPEQNEEVVAPTDPVIGTEEQETIAAYVEAAFDASGIDYRSRVAYQGGFKWLNLCPWKSEHSEGEDFNSSTAVIMWPSGKLIYECKHKHCEGIRQWEQLRDWMQEKTGQVLQFGDSVPLAGLTPHVYDVKPLTENEIMSVVAPCASDAPDISGLGPIPAPQDTSTPTSELYENLMAQRREIESQIEADDATRQTTGKGELEKLCLENSEWHVAQACFYLYGTHLRFVTIPNDPDGEWRLWNGKTWDKTASSVYLRSIVVKTGEYIEQKMIPNEPEDKQRKKLAVVAARCRQVGFSGNVVEHMKRPALLLNPVFDQKPWLFNFNNGTYDLLENSFRKFRREDYLTVRTSANYDPAAEGKCPTWYLFLENCFDEKEVREFFLRWIGVAGFGYAIKEFILGYGRTDNGKTIIAKIIGLIYGPYCKRSDFSMLSADAKQQAGGARADISALDGVRCTIFDESDSKQKLSESKLKELTGAGDLSARDLFKGQKEISAAFKTFMFTNFRPPFSNDDAIWERLNALNFANSYKQGHPKRIKDVFTKLRAEKSAIAIEFLKGARQWLEMGELRPPASVKSTKETYRGELDFVAGFLNKGCELDAAFCASQTAETRYEAEVSQLYNFYVMWSRLEGNAILMQRDFGQRLTDKGIKPSKHHGYHRQWSGVRIIPQALKDVQTASSGVSLGSSTNNTSAGDVNGEQIPF